MNENRSVARVLVGALMAAGIFLGAAAPAQAADSGWNGTRSVQKADSGWNGTR